MTQPAALKRSRTRKSDQAVAPPSTPATQASAAPTQAPPAAASDPRSPAGKLGVLLTLLRREGGATLEEMTAATGWQAHSVRGALSGSLKKKLGIAIVSEKVEDVRRYRVAP